METATLDGENGRSLTLSKGRSADPDGIWSYFAELSLPGGGVQSEVWDSDDALARFVRTVADSWQGFDGTMEFSSLEGQLRLSCRHDGLATVECEVTLRQPEPPTWSLTAVLTFGAGAHLDRIAAAVESLVASRDVA